MRRTILIAFFVGGLVAAAPPTREPAVPGRVLKRAIEADADALRKSLEYVSGDPEKRKGAGQTSKIIAMMIIRYAERLDDTGTKTQAINVLQAIEKKDWIRAAKIVEAPVKAKADPDVLKSRLPALTPSEVGAAFRSSKSHGLNIDHDLRSQLKEPSDLDLVELVAVRTLILSGFLAELPPRVFDQEFKKNDWDCWCRDMERISTDIISETQNGQKADKKKVADYLRKLNANCSNCHQMTGRDSP